MLEVLIITNDRLVVTHPKEERVAYEFKRWWTVAKFREALGVSYQVVTNWKARQKLEIAEVIVEPFGINVQLVDMWKLDGIKGVYLENLPQEIKNIRTNKTNKNVKKD